MNEFEINVDIKNNKLIAPVIELVQNDYNSTKFKFNFMGDNNYVKTLQLQLPDGSTWIKDIVNNEVVLSDEKDGQTVPILVQSGKYIFDIAIYSNNAKLTTTNQESFFVRSEITGKNVELDDRLPILDSLIMSANKIANIDFKQTVINILIEYGLINLSNLTQEQTKALNEMQCSIDENGTLNITYDDTVLDLKFQIEDKNLIINNNINATFSINDNGEMEVYYE